MKTGIRLSPTWRKFKHLVPVPTISLLSSLSLLLCSSLLGSLLKQLLEPMSLGQSILGDGSSEDKWSGILICWDIQVDL